MRAPSSPNRLRRRLIRLFYLDDQQNARERMQKLCEDTPQRDLIYAGEEFKNPVDLLDKIRASRADVVIVDQRLHPFGLVQPYELSGLHAIKRVREEFGQSLKIMALTAYGHYDADAKAAGADVVIHKGIPNEDLREAIRTLASSRGQAVPRAKVGGTPTRAFSRTSMEENLEAKRNIAHHSNSPEEKIGIFHLEDEEVFRGGIQNMCELTPEGDLRYAAWAENNTPDLVDEVAKSRADVAIIDLLLDRFGPYDIERTLDTPLTSGLPSVKPIFYTRESHIVDGK